MLNRACVTAVVATFSAATTVTAQHPNIDREVERLVSQVTEIRHRIHEYPELGNREVETAALVADHLRGLGFDDIRTGIAHTGVVAVLRGGKPGPIIRGIAALNNLFHHAGFLSSSAF